ncbi:MAG: hypothetical protein VXY07_06485 [Planctomycetota bacterium]|jgi:hypothetical protein|nr:hypothetical protein [Planctomycetota bacterium]
MSLNLDALSQPEKSRPRVWEIYIPFSVAVLPAAMFAGLGLVTKDYASPDAVMSPWAAVLMIFLEVTGIIAMALVILARWGSGSAQLQRKAGGRPAFWRSLLLGTSTGCLLLFDVLTNVAAAFDGATPLLAIAAPVFGVYVLTGRMAFLGLQGSKYPR